MTTLIAGCGDLGTRVARLLHARGESVAALSRSGRAPEGALAIRADLTRPETLTALAGRFDTLIYAVAPDARDEATYRRVYVQGLIHVIDAIGPGLRRGLFVSSTAVYGDLAGAWADETTPTEPERFNGRVLLEAEHALALRVPEAVSLRLGGIYGPGREQLIERVRSGLARCTPGQWTNRIHVDDAARAVVHVRDLAAPAPCYLVVDPAPALECEVHAWLADALGVPRIAPGDGEGVGRGIGNRRLSSALLASSGFTWRYPDYRAGYASLIGRAER